jgi:hypothetical protein
MAKKLTKKELLAILVDDYGYEKDDIKMLTNAKLEAMIKAEEKDAETLEAEATIERVQDEYVQIKDEDMIQVMNGENGELIHRSGRSGRMWKFTRFGQTDRMPFIELMNIYNVNPRCFEEGRLIILNKQVAENFRLTEIYKNIITPQNLDELFSKNVDELKEIVDKLPESMRLTFVIRARELYAQGKLDSMKLINYIQDTFGFSLEDNAPTKDLVF